MKRFHVHVAVENLDDQFLLDAVRRPAERHKARLRQMDARRPHCRLHDLAAGAKPGIEHLGIQVENEAELAEVYERLGKAEQPVIKGKAITCCYAQSDKQWIADPTGISWQTFLTQGEATVYGGGLAAKRESDTACCAQAAE